LASITTVDTSVYPLSHHPLKRNKKVKEIEEPKRASRPTLHVFQLLIAYNRERAIPDLACAKKSNCLQNEVYKITSFPVLSPLGNVIVNDDDECLYEPTSQIFADKQRSANYQIGWQVNRDSRTIH
jgi:hypothetical protein